MRSKWVTSEEDLIECPECKKSFDKYGIHWNNDLSVCDKCSENFVRCNVCGDIVLKYLSYSIDDYDYCVKCVNSPESGISYCDFCQDYVIASRYDDKDYCPNCDNDFKVCKICGGLTSNNHSGYDDDIQILCKLCYKNTVLVNQMTLL